MVSLDCTTSREAEITLVTGRIENQDRPRRVRVENQLDGPVWPPRRRGVPAAGWTDDGFECRLGADETRALGYASPAPPADPPLVVTETEPVGSELDDPSFEPRGDVPSVEETPTDVVRTLGSPRPPRDAVPVPEGDPEPAAGGDEPATAAAAGDPPGERSGVETGSNSAGSGARAAGDGHPVEPRADAVDAWFAAVDARLELADQLSETTRLPVVADALERAGGLAGVRGVAEQLDEDAAALRRVAERATELADRAETATVPVEPIERLR